MLLQPKKSVTLTPEADGTWRLPADFQRVYRLAAHPGNESVMIVQRHESDVYDFPTVMLINGRVVSHGRLQGNETLELLYYAAREGRERTVREVHGPLRFGGSLGQRLAAAPADDDPSAMLEAVEASVQALVAALRASTRELRHIAQQAGLVVQGSGVLASRIRENEELLRRLGYGEAGL